MNILKFAIKNLTQRKVRTFLTIGGVALAVSVLVSLIGFDHGYQQALNRDVDKMGFQLLITAKGCPYEAATLMLKGGGGLRYMENEIYEKIIRDPRIDTVTPQLVHTVYDSDKNNGQGGLSMYMGIDDTYLKLKPWMTFKSGNWFSDPQAEEVLMGYEAAEIEQRKVGDKIFIPKVNKVLTVAGVFERSGTQDDGVIFLPIKTTQNIFDLKDKLTGIGIKLQDISLITEFEEDLYEEPGIQIVSMAQVKGTIFNLVSSAKVLVNAVATIAILIAVLGVINTILMSVFERTREIGVMKAIGASSFHVFQLIWIETTAICFLGGVIGCLVAFLGGNLVEYLIKMVIPYAPSGQIILITPQLILFAMIGTIILGLIAGIYPSMRAAFTHPIDAIRKGDV